MNDGTTDQACRLARRLRELRQARGLSVQQLADLAGTSRATISRIENAEVSPTAEMLGRLAGAFSLSLSRLLAPLDETFRPLVRAGEQAVWVDASSGYTRRILSPATGSLDVELLRCDIPAMTTIAYPVPPVPGQEHHIAMLEGTLEVMLDDETFELGPGDALRYRLLGASRFRAGAQGARYILALH